MSEGERASPILRTKLHVPAGGKRIVARPRLAELLDEGAAGPVTLVSAPAGFGKSALVGEWARRVTAPVAWLSLDSADSDLARFIAYVAAALEEVDPALGSSARTTIGHTQSFEADALLADLLNEVAELGRSLVLVLDDVHTVEGPGVFEWLTVLLDRLPPNLHLVLVGREDPPLPLAKYRARGALAEIRARDLRFDKGESAAFLNGSMGLDLSANDLETLDSRTEGWVAGLQLAALSIAGRTDAHAFIESFSAVNRHIVDFLMDEVLSRQSDEVRGFLLRTSVLDRLTGPLCEYLTGERRGKAVLRELEQRNLFLLPLDDERTWYRYHGLFAGSLRERLDEEAPGEAGVLHARASEWFAEQGMTEEAVHHAIEAGDDERAAHLAEDAWGELINSSRAQTVWDWTGAISDEVLRGHPRLLAARAWAAFLTHRIADVVGLLPEIESILGARAADDPDASEAAGHVMAIKSFLARARGEIRASIELAEAALERNLENAPGLVGVLSFSLGWSYLEMGQPDRALPHLETGARAGEHGNYYAGLVCSGLMGQLHLMRGDLAAAEALLRTAIDSGRAWGHGRQLPAAAFALASLGDVAYERNRLDEAERAYGAANELADASNDHSVRSRAAGGPIKVALARGDLALAHELFAREVEDQVEHHGTEGRALSAPDAVRVALAEGALAEARTWRACAPELSGEMGTRFSIDWIPFARFAIAIGEHAGVAPVIATALDHARAQGLAGLECGLLGLTALVRDAGGDARAAMDSLEQAVGLAERLGFMRSLLDLGAPLTRSLASLQAAGRAGSYAEELLAQVSVLGDEAGPRLGEGVLQEPLTQREAEVLAHMADGLTYQGVADALFLSVNTVRHHVKSLYRKLEVNSQNEAVARARKLGLL